MWPATPHTASRSASADCRSTLDRLLIIFNKLKPGKEVVLQLKEPVPGVWKRFDERSGERQG